MTTLYGTASNMKETSQNVQGNCRDSIRNRPSQPSHDLKPSPQRSPNQSEIQASIKSSYSPASAESTPSSCLSSICSVSKKYATQELSFESSIRSDMRRSSTQHIYANFLKDLENESVDETTHSDIWSLNESENMSLNLTTVLEDAPNSSFSPTDFFSDLISCKSKDLDDSRDTQVKESPREIMSKLTLSKLHSTPSITSTPVCKRRLSSVEESPCKRLASQIEILQSPARFAKYLAHNDNSSQKVWNPSLDEEVLRCYNKYIQFRNSQVSSEIFKYTTKNKIISRMLLNRTGQFRTPKQVSARVQRLLKLISVENSSLLETYHSAGQQYTANHPNQPRDILPVQFNSSSGCIEPYDPRNSSYIQSSEPARFNCSQKTSFDVSSQQFSQLAPYSNIPTSDTSSDSSYLEEFHISFNYKDPLQKNHVFSRFNSSSLQTSIPFQVSAMSFEKTIRNSSFRSSFLATASMLEQKGVIIHNLVCDVCFNANSGQSMPQAVLPATPSNISLDKGYFLSHVKLNVPLVVSTQSFITWNTVTTIYKDSDRVLLRTNEHVNGFRTPSGDFSLHVPLLSKFWSGYLTFLINGSNNFDELLRLTLVQEVFNGDALPQNIHAYLIYNFSPSTHSRGTTSVQRVLLKESLVQKAQLDDEDEVETILAPSSPIESRSGLEEEPSNKQPFAFTDHIAQSKELELLSLNSVDFRPSLGLSKSTNSVFDHSSLQGPFHPPALQSNSSFVPGDVSGNVGNVRNVGNVPGNLPSQATVATRFVSMGNPMETGSELIENGFHKKLAVHQDPALTQPVLLNRTSMGCMNDVPENSMAQQEARRMHRVHNAANPPRLQPIDTNQRQHSFRMEINSAPATKLSFFPGNVGNVEEPSKNGTYSFRFEPIVKYEPKMQNQTVSLNQFMPTKFQKFEGNSHPSSK